MAEALHLWCCNRPVQGLLLLLDPESVNPHHVLTTSFVGILINFILN